MNRKLYITTAIPYVNAAPHVGFALELVQADAIARFHRLRGRTVRFQTGTDENAIKNVLAAREQGVSPRELVDRHAQLYRDLAAALDANPDDFIRTTEDRHRRGVHEFWRRLEADDVYRQDYRGLYCTGCEDFYQADELASGCCPEHGVPPVEVNESNYFFRLSAYERRIEDLLTSGRLKVVPEARRNEVLSFVRLGLRDFSMSRPASRSYGWGTPVPGDPSQVVYVWVDALINYVSGPGLGSSEDWQQWWGDGAEKVHVIGKNVWKFHAVYWPALLLSARLPLPDTLVVHGFVTAEGRKIGKSLGNAIDPFALVEEFGADAVRHYLLRAIPPFEDGDFSRRRLGELYRCDLANGLGNLVSRLAALSRKADVAPPPGADEPPEDFAAAIESYEFDRASAALWQEIDSLNRRIETVKPWQLAAQQDHAALQGHLREWLGRLSRLAYWLKPLLPRAAGSIREALAGLPARGVQPLFPRLR